MARRDLTNEEIRELGSVEPGWQLGRKQVDYIKRLIGEVQELRDREAAARHIHGLETEF